MHKTLYVIVHTETYYNKMRRFCGLADSVLTPKGHRQAEKLARGLRGEKIGLAFDSPLRRTRQTLAHIKKYHPEMKIIVDKRLRERDYGRLTRKSKEKYEQEHPRLYKIYHRSYRVPPPGGESMTAVEKRVLAFLKDVIKKMRREQKNALIVAHNNSVRPIRRYLERLTPKQMMKLKNREQIFCYEIRL